ncbi:MAG: hypothetical protein D6B25_09180 [Desulfobulbaceae bacterium]|nr:MAG: hypothetical protein D6B25_09180 [Desulfobulbaceae bacterium]
MLSTNKIAGAFLAIVEEAEKALEKELPKKAEKRLKTIISIAKHQSDIRKSEKGSCKGHAKKCCAKK